jgi:hypothetical protein
MRRLLNDLTVRFGIMLIVFDAIVVTAWVFMPR